jgi:hypothetical protein
MVIAFSTKKSADSAGMHLTKLFSSWVEEMTDEGKRIEIINVNSSASKNGWMMIVQYKILEEEKKKK